MIYLKLPSSYTPKLEDICLHKSITSEELYLFDGYRILSFVIWYLSEIN